MSAGQQKTPTKSRPPNISISSHISSAKSSPRTPRFVEATSVLSPVEQSKPIDKHFSQANLVNKQPQTQPQPSTLQQSQSQTHDANPQSADIGVSSVANKTPKFYRIEPPWPSSFSLKHAGSKSSAPSLEAQTKPNVVLVPTIVEDEVWEKDEEQNIDDDDFDAQDEKARATVNVIKLVIRGFNLAVSLAMIALLALSLAEYNATKGLPHRESYSSWPKSPEIWPQIMLLAISCIAFFLSAIMLRIYLRARKRGGHWMTKFTPFAVILFIGSIIMWVIGAVLLLLTKSNGGGSDLWGWSCHSGKSQHVFQDAVQYGLVCHVQEASFILCIVQVLIELATVVVYGFVFHRLWTQRDTGSETSSSDLSASGSGAHFVKVRAELVNEDTHIGSTDLEGDEDIVSTQSRFEPPPLVTRSSSAKLRTRLSRRSERRQSTIREQTANVPASDENPDVEERTPEGSCMTSRQTETIQQPRPRPRGATTPHSTSSHTQRPGRLSLQIPSSHRPYAPPPQQHPQQHVYYEHMTYAYPPTTNAQSASAEVYSSYAVPVGVGRTLGPGGVIVGPVTPVSPIYAMGAGQKVFGVAR